MCGVLPLSLYELGGVLGSSPHVRGFVLLVKDFIQHFRFIPACAGFCFFQR